MTCFKEKNRGNLFIISAPSGTGKTTVVGELVQEHAKEMERVITCTTRPPRLGEVNGKDYHFLSSEEYQKKIEESGFLEYQEIYDHSYGTLKEDVEKILASGKHALLVIDVQGAAELMKKVDATTIFLTPPSMQELEQRIRSRNKDEEQEIQKRLSQAKEEMKQADCYDYIVANQHVEDTVWILRSVIIAVEYQNRRKKNGRIKTA